MNSLPVSNPRILIIVPAHNEAENLPVLLPEIQALGLETLVINDCSADETEEILRKRQEAYLSLPVNAGLAAVTQMGFRYALEHGYDAAIVIDGDGQHPPKYIHTLIEAVQRGNDYVVGSRYAGKKKPFTMRMIGSRLLSLAIRIKTGRKIADPTSGMRALGTRVLKEFAETMNFIAEPDALAYVLKRGYKVEEVPVQMKERVAGTSYFHNPAAAVRFMYDSLISILFLQ